MNISILENVAVLNILFPYTIPLSAKKTLLKSIIAAYIPGPVKFKL
jgi:hypothetical protein